MAYTRTWDNAAPPGSALANTLDTIIQEFRIDTQQRISSLLAAGTDINTDPLQLKTNGFGAFTNAVRVLNPFLGTDLGNGSRVAGLQGSDGRAHLVGIGGGLVTGAFDVSAVLDVPLNAEITLVEIFGLKSLGLSSNVRLYTVNITTGVQTLIATPGALPLVYGVINTGVFAGPTIGSGTLLILRINATGAPSNSCEVEIGGVRVTFNIAAGSWRP